MVRQSKGINRELHSHDDIAPNIFTIVKLHGCNAYKTCSPNSDAYLYINRYFRSSNNKVVCMQAMPFCPVERTVRVYKMIDRKVLMSLIKMNWRMVVLNIVVSSGIPMRYGEIAKESGLSSRTLSLILKELLSENLIDKKPYPGNPTLGYSATIVGKRLATIPCPILKLASDGSVEV